ncbi:UNVERIFIED_CONTAM: hypothetical protein NCL1_12827 [Trichonephila clavipes]
MPISNAQRGKEFREKIPAHLSTLDLVSERLISLRIPFMQIRVLCKIPTKLPCLLNRTVHKETKRFKRNKRKS